MISFLKERALELVKLFFGPEAEVSNAGLIALVVIAIAGTGLALYCTWYR